MLVLKFQFPAGRYHATQWGRNVNEGIVDWPPSPWRILRAIISSWKIHHNSIASEQMWPILEELLSDPVSFYLPPCTQSHTRHYMPIKEKTEKVLDSFIVIDKKESLVAIWGKADLDAKQVDVLSKVIKSIRYLGRAESLCDIRLAKESDKQPNCLPFENNADLLNKDIIEVLIPDIDASLDDLCQTTQSISKCKLAYPHKSHLARYVRPADCLATKQQSLLAQNSSHANVMRYLITGNVRPRVTESVRIGDFIKRVVMSLYGKQNPNAMSPVFSGKDSNRKHLEGHQHAFFIPTDEDGDNILDHMTIIAQKPFNKEEFAALDVVDEIRYRDVWFNLAYLARGKIDDFRKVPILQSAKKWRSVTPFVLNRHPKVRGVKGDKYMVDGPEDQLRREIRNRFGENVTIKNLTIKDSKSKMECGLMPIQFKRWRKNGLPGFGAYDVHVEFEENIQGPLSLGHGSHFGLGLFAPDE